ncbi:hypothetical protein IWZ00DRAFT_341475 [Phyllosticta capitalensis]
MEKLPNELLVHILSSVLEPADIVKAQSVSRRFLSVARDATLWKKVWWDPTYAPRRLPPDNSAEGNGPLSFLSTRLATKALATTSIPGQKTDFYEEYIAAHAPISVSWVHNSWTDRRFETGHNDGSDDEAIGIGLLYNDGTRKAERIFSPMDDGSITVWNISRDSTAKMGVMLDRTHPGQVGGSPKAGSASGSVDNVTIDSGSKKGYFAVNSTLAEVDLNTMQTVSQNQFPFNITALSQARHPVPLTVGTTGTIHLHDVRKSSGFGAPDFSTRCESITDANTRSSVCELGPSPVSTSPVCQHKPLSILHLPLPGAADVSHSIWVAGRFPSLLHYDRRYFPKLAGNIYSGGDLSSLTYLPHAFVDWDRHAYVEGTDTTIVAAGDYKGKGSLELYGVSAAATTTTTSLPKRPRSTNRNTSLLRILAVGSQGARVVASDCFGNLVWWYRDGKTKARTFNINEALQTTSPYGTAPSPAQDNIDHLYAQYAADLGDLDPYDPVAQPEMVLKMRTTVAPSSWSPTTTATTTDGGGGLNDDALVVQTDNGRVGLVAFGEANALEPQWHEAAQDAAELAHQQQERRYGCMMRRVLENHSRELNWMSSLGMGP